MFKVKNESNKLGAKLHQINNRITVLMTLWQIHICFIILIVLVG